MGDSNDSEESRSASQHEDVEAKIQHQARFSQRINHFVWPWFACTMSTGGVAVVIAQQPYTFPGLQAIGKLFFILDLVLFVAFCAAISYRFINNTRTFRKSLHRAEEAFFFGSFWVSVSLILTCMQLYGVSSSGPWLVKALEILFWTYGACALLVAISQYSTLFVAEKLAVSSAMPAWVFPAYPLLVIGSLAAAMIPNQPADSALRILIGGIIFQGGAWMLSIFMYTIYIVRLVSSELPPPPKRPGMFIGVGPAGYTSAALVGLANRAPSTIPPGFLSLPGFNVGAALKVTGVFAGLFLWLLAFWFFALTIVSIAHGFRRMSFTLSWWAFIFPNAGLTLAAIQIGNALNSPAIQAVTSAMTILLVIAWLVVAVANIRAVVKRQILWEGKDEDVE